MLEESGSVWEVKFQKKRDGDEKFDTRKTRIGKDWHSAVELADQHIDTDGATFKPLLGSYLIQGQESDEEDETLRVVISEKDMHTRR